VGYVPSGHYFGHYFSGSVVDAGMEGVSNAGVHFLSADQETIQGGTSEQNKYGILINTSASGVNSGTSNKFNMVLTMDLEGNQVNFQGSDVTDNSSLNTFWNVLSATACSSCQAVQLSTTGEDYYPWASLLLASRVSQMAIRFLELGSRRRQRAQPHYPLILLGSWFSSSRALTFFCPTTTKLKLEEVRSPRASYMEHAAW
jgi:hypothetical protein